MPHPKTESRNPDSPCSVLLSVSIRCCPEESSVTRVCTGSRGQSLSSEDLKAAHSSDMFLPPSHNSSSGNATVEINHIIWAPSIPPIDRTELHQTISIHGILIRASQLRNGIDCTFAFGSDEKQFSGGQCIIFVVQYADNIRYAFRLPYHSRE
jgi:hypothetical protein